MLCAAPRQIYYNVTLISWGHWELIMFRPSGAWVTLLCLGIALVWCARERASADTGAIEARHGLVVSVSAPGSDVGVSILKRGGNAVDAAVATALALAVTYPAAGNIGGGGFMLVYPADKGEPLVIDYRETAPAAASKTMFPRGARLYGPRVVGVPGTLRGLELSHKRFGKLPWKTLVMPAVELADKGFVLDAAVARSLNKVLAAGRDFAELQRVFGKRDGSDWVEGDRLVQPDLARTLRLVALDGADAFYHGKIAELIVAEMKTGDGVIDRNDLAGYKAHARAPIRGKYRGYDVYAPPPPSSGGICLVEMLNVLEEFDLRKMGRWSPATLHLLAETMRRAFCDRARYLGDPAFITIPAHLTSSAHARKLAGTIDRTRATPSAGLAPEIALAGEGDCTTHFSVIDKDGMAVANTYTLERSYGSRVVVKDAGFLLNNEMMDFNWYPGYTDRKGTIGTAPNLIAPGKRMLSSQTPTIVAKDGKVALVTGSPGSRTIINTVLCVLVNALDFDMDIAAAVAAPRLHHQWLPDEIRFEGISEYPEATRALRRMGHRVQGARQGDAHSIRVDPQTGKYMGAADRRISGKVSGY
jgi:gamma-glutamyltranspeptidase/glutathione hydrolase